MTIYTSEKVMPYVYMCIHKQTGQFYIGSRTTKFLKVPSHLDLPSYKTSSKLVKPIFEEFNWIILAEFFDPIAAYDYEQTLIQYYWNDANILNNNYVAGPNKLLVTGTKWSDDRRAQASIKRKGQGVGRKHSDKTKQKMSQNYSRTGFHHTTESRQKLSVAHKGKFQGTSWWNNGHVNMRAISCPGNNWISGKLQRCLEGARWWNNGVTNTRAVDCPGDGWTLGQLRKQI